MLLLVLETKLALFLLHNRVEGPHSTCFVLIKPMDTQPLL